MGRQLSRGDVCWMVFPPPDNRRPGVILTRDSAIGYLNRITVAPITTTLRSLPSYVVLTPDVDGVPEYSVVNLDCVLSISTKRIGPFIMHLSDTRMREIEAALLFALGVDDRP